MGCSVRRLVDHRGTTPPQLATLLLLLLLPAGGGSPLRSRYRPRASRAEGQAAAQGDSCLECARDAWHRGWTLAKQKAWQDRVRRAAAAAGAKTLTDIVVVMREAGLTMMLDARADAEFSSVSRWWAAGWRRAGGRAWCAAGRAGGIGRGRGGMGAQLWPASAHAPLAAGWACMRGVLTTACTHVGFMPIADHPPPLPDAAAALQAHTIGGRFNAAVERIQAAFGTRQAPLTVKVVEEVADAVMNIYSVAAVKVRLRGGCAGTTGADPPAVIHAPRPQWSTHQQWEHTWQWQPPPTTAAARGAACLPGAS